MSPQTKQQQQKQTKRTPVIECKSASLGPPPMDLWPQQTFWPPQGVPALVHPLNSVGAHLSPTLRTCFLPDHRCHSQEHFLINILGAKLHLCFQGNLTSNNYTSTRMAEIFWKRKTESWFSCFWNITDWKQTHAYMASWFLTKEQQQFNGERIIISTNGAGTTGQPYGKIKSKQKREKPWLPVPHNLYKS